MIRVRVPATSANMGSGFDSIGVALDMHNEVLFEESDHIDISCITGHDINTTEQNLIYQCASVVYKTVGRPMKGLKIVEACHIPMVRGLGSSSACTVAGLLGANALLGDPLSPDTIIDLAAQIEGHPDNSTPALRGGFVAAMVENGKVWQVRVPISGSVSFCVFVPNFELKTEKARAVLPKTVTREDAIFNLGRAALLAGSLVTGDLHNIRVATADRLHQQYRLPLIPEGAEIMEMADSLGALGVYISGAGPSIVAITKRNDTQFLMDVAARCAVAFPNWKPIALHCDEIGATVAHV